MRRRGDAESAAHADGGSPPDRGLLCRGRGRRSATRHRRRSPNRRRTERPTAGCSTGHAAGRPGRQAETLRRCRFTADGACGGVVSAVTSRILAMQPHWSSGQTTNGHGIAHGPGGPWTWPIWQHDRDAPQLLLGGAEGSTRRRRPVRTRGAPGLTAGWPFGLPELAGPARIPAVAGPRVSPMEPRFSAASVSRALDAPEP